MLDEVIFMQFFTEFTRLRIGSNLSATIESTASCEFYPAHPDVPNMRSPKPVASHGQIETEVHAKSDSIADDDEVTKTQISDKSSSAEADREGLVMDLTRKDSSTQSSSSDESEAQQISIPYPEEMSARGTNFDPLTTKLSRDQSNKDSSPSSSSSDESEVGEPTVPRPRQTIAKDLYLSPIKPMQAYSVALNAFNSSTTPSFSSSASFSLKKSNPKSPPISTVDNTFLEGLNKDYEPVYMFRKTTSMTQTEETVHHVQNTL